MVAGNRKRTALLRGALLGGTVLACLAAGRAGAAVIASDNFDSYSAGTVNGANAGSGWGGAWSGSNVISDNAGNTFGMPSTGRRLATIGSSMASYRAIGGGNRQPTTGNDIWIGFLANVPSLATATYAYGGVSLFSGVGGTGERLFIGRLNNQDKWGLSQDRNSSGGFLSSANKVIPNIPIDPNSTAFLVTRLYLDAGTPKVDFFVNPPAEGPGTPAGSTTLSAFTFNTLRVESGTASTQKLNVDELRLGTTFADVMIPEPSTIGVVGLGAAGMLLRRRRRVTA